MKKIMTLVAAASSFICAAAINSIDITSEKTPCSRLSLLGLTAEAKRLMLIDDNDTGSITMKIGRSATT